METFPSKETPSLSSQLRALGLSAGHVSDLVNGKKRPSLDLAVRIERELGIPPSRWVVGVQDGVMPSASQIEADDHTRIDAPVSGQPAGEFQGGAI